MPRAKLAWQAEPGSELSWVSLGRGFSVSKWEARLQAPLASPWINFSVRFSVV